MRHKTRYRAGLLCLVWLLWAAPLSAAAEADCALTVRYPCPDVTFQLYRVGTADSEDSYALTGDFASYSVSLTNLDAQGWAGAAEALDGYAARDGLEPLKTETTDENGTLTFSGLTPGLYLVRWAQHTTDGEIYTPQPFLTVLSDSAAGSAVTVTPKYEKTPASPPSGGGGREDTVDFWVYLRWGGGSHLAPASVTVQLLRNGAVYDEAELSDANGWSCRWQGLDRRYNWQVVQKDVPAGFAVTVDRDGSAFVLTNTPTASQTAPAPTAPPSSTPTDHPAASPAPTAPADPGAAPVPPSPDAPSAPAEPSATGDPEDTAKPSEPKIPQTGQLWWPVPLLALAGLGLYLLGWWYARRDDHGE